MLIFLYGVNTYFLRRKLKEIIQHYQTIRKSGLNLKIFDSHDLDFDTLRNLIFQTTMFGERRLIVIKNLFSNRILAQAIFKQREKFLDISHVVVFTQEGEVNEKENLFQFLIKNSKWQKFSFTPLGMQQFLDQEFKKRGFSVPSELILKLASWLGNDFYRAEQEVRKLCNFKKFEKKITSQDLDLFFQQRENGRIFTMVDYLISREKSKAIKILEQFLKKGENPFYLLSLVAQQFRRILLAKVSPENLKKENLSFWQIKKYRSLAGIYSLGELKRIYQEILATELSIKKGESSPLEAIRSFFVRV